MYVYNSWENVFNKMPVRFDWIYNMKGKNYCDNAHFFHIGTIHVYTPIYYTYIQYFHNANSLRYYRYECIARYLKIYILIFRRES